MAKNMRWQDADEETRQTHLLKIYSGGKGWTTEPPTERGWYWVVEKEDREIDLVRVFRADHGGKDKPLEVWIDQYESMHLSDFTHWLGPLPIPEPPKGE